MGGYGQSLARFLLLEFLCNLKYYFPMQNSDHHISSYIGARFAQQGVRFFHAENIEGIRAHCEAGHLLCRKMLMEAIPDAYTHFESDPYDVAYGFDVRVFGNIYDLGAIYARANLGSSQNPAAPNIYGPIVLVFRPDVFSVMRDIVITPKSSWKTKPKWREVSVQTEAQVEELLTPDQPKDNIADTWQYAELSCANPKIPLSYLEKILVEPLTLPGMPTRRELLHVVRKIAERCRIHVPIEARDFTDRTQRFKPANLELLQRLADFCGQIPPDVTQQTWASTPFVLPPEFQQLPNSMTGKMMRFARYYTFGTVRARPRAV